MLLLVIILLIRLLSANPISNYCNRDQVLNYTWCDGGETILVARGSRYLEKECHFYFIPYENLNATLCPLSILNMTSDDNKCYRLFYPNGTFRTLNIQMEEAPSILKIDTETIISPFNGDLVNLYCPLYGFPSLEINWSIPFNHTERFDGLSRSRINYLHSTGDPNHDVGLDTILSSIATGGEDDLCDLKLVIFYNWFLKLEGDYYCTGRNKFGIRTVLIANINNGSLCLSSENSDYLRFENLLIELQPVYKVSEDKIGGNVTIICKLLPYTRNVLVGWMKTEHLGSGIDICPGSNATHGLLRNGEQYTVREWSESGKKENGPKCTKVVSLTIHAFKLADRGEYSCVAQICSNSIPSTKINSKSTRITGDNLNIKTDTWVFSLTALPVLTILILLVVTGILIYAHRYRIIRWYIAWRREEPKGNFEFEIFICMAAEEFDANLIADVKREIVDKAISSDSSVLWSENEDINSIGLSHYVIAEMRLEKCRKFIFVVNEKFGHCFFCKQMVELATEKSSGKNWNIILPIKWTADAIVPAELMRYRYIERETGSDYFHKIENFLTGRSESDRNRTRRDYQMVEMNPLGFVNEDADDD